LIGFGVFCILFRVRSEKQRLSAYESALGRGAWHTTHGRTEIGHIFFTEQVGLVSCVFRTGWTSSREYAVDKASQRLPPLAGHHTPVFSRGNLPFVIPYSPSVEIRSVDSEMSAGLRRIRLPACGKPRRLPVIPVKDFKSELRYCG
jgi:hypothetical protein